MEQRFLNQLFCAMSSTVSPSLICQRSEPSPRRGFTLIELLVVISVIAMLLAISVPTLVGSLGGARLTQAGDALFIYMSEAQQRAMATGRPVELRLYRIASETDSISGNTDAGSVPFRGALMLEFYNQGERDPRSDLDPSKSGTLQKPLAVARRGLLVLPSGAAMTDNASLSTLVNPFGSSYSAKTDGGGGVETIMRSGSGYKTFEGAKGQQYYSFTFFPESTSLDTNIAQKWHVTVVADSELGAAAEVVKNFYTISVDALTGRLTAYRP